MRILVSNDDGIYSPGIAALAEVASEFGTVRVVAPDVERSSTGHAITASRPLSYRATNIKGLTAYRVNGTPADCVTLGMSLKTRHELAYLRRTNSGRAEDKRREHEDWLVLVDCDRSE